MSAPPPSDEVATPHGSAKRLDPADKGLAKRVYSSAYKRAMKDSVLPAAEAATAARAAGKAATAALQWQQAGEVLKYAKQE
eukprot:12837322-Heterocapsa_arctica.AAC.1